MIKTLRIALAQINTRVADFPGNCAKIITSCQQVADDADLIIFPELAISGCKPKDLLNYSDFVEGEKQAIAAMLPQIPANLAVVFGHLRRRGDALYNTISLALNGRFSHQQDKIIDLNCDDSNERRYFHSATQHSCFDFNGLRLGLAVYEECQHQQHQGVRLDYQLDSVQKLCQQGAELLLVIAASPLEFNHSPNGIYSKDSHRKQLLRSYGRAACYLNLVGANDALIFDGQSFALDAQGKLLTQLEAFKEELRIVDITVTSDSSPASHSKLASPLLQKSTTENLELFVQTSRPSMSEESYYQQLQQALKLGLRDYVQKSGFSCVHLGLSGGIDSALVATLAVQALGADKVRLFALPSRHNLASSYSDAAQLASNLKVQLESLAIESLFVEFLRVLEPSFAGCKPDLSEENLQARIRGVLMMAIANKFSSLLLLTGNKSEFATGYATLYGDMCGSLAVIGDLFKTEVFALCRYLNSKAGWPLIPINIIEKEPSAELSFNQKDSDSLPPYHLLDQILSAYLLEAKSPSEININGVDDALLQSIISRVDRQEYKRYQAAPVLKVTASSFGRGRLLPLACYQG